MGGSRCRCIALYLNMLKDNCLFIIRLVSIVCGYVCIYCLGLLVGFVATDLDWGLLVWIGVY